VSLETQSVLLNALPLLALAAALAAVAVLLAVSWRARGRIEAAELGLLCLLATLAVVAATLGALVLHDSRPLGGQLWVSFAAIAVALPPSVLVLARWRRVTPSITGASSGRDRREQISMLGSELEAVGPISSALGRVDEPRQAAGVVLDEVRRLLGLQFAAIALVGADESEATGLLAQDVAGEVEWWSRLRLDLVEEPSAIASVVSEGASLTIFDLSESPIVNRRLAERVGATSAAFVPLVVGGRVTGVLVAAATGERRAFSSGELVLLEAIAGEAALALDRTRAAGELAAALERQTALLQASRVVTGELRLETVLQRLVEEVAKLLESEAADCYLIDAEQGVFRCAAVHGLPLTMLGFEFPLERGLAARAVAGERSVRADDYDAKTLPVPNDAYRSFAGAIVAPMTWSGETRGVLGAGRRDPARPFGEADAQLLEAFASLASLALQNAESFELSARQARVERGFYRVATLLGEPLSHAETLDAVAQAACVSLGGDGSCVLMPEPGGLVLAGAHELVEPVAKAIAPGSVTAASLQIAAREGRVLAAAQLAADDRFDGPFREAVTASYRSLIAVPVQALRSEEHGLVVVFFVEEQAFTEDDLELGRHLAQAARGALERSELFETERRSRALSQELARSGTMVATELDPAAVLDELVDRAPALLRAEAGAVWLAEGEELLVVAASGEGLDDVVGARAPLETRPVGDTAHAQLPVALASVSDLPQGRDPVLARGFEGFLGVPLALPEGRGVLAVYSREARSWRQEEVESLAALAGNAAAALSNAVLYQRVAHEKERSVAILANIADGIVAVDRDGRVVLWNAAAERITGVSGAEALGREPSQLLHRRLESPGDAPAGDRVISIGRANEEVWLSVTEAVMRDPAGDVLGRIFAFRDISGDLAVEQLKSEFVWAVSHELRTPLTSIYGFAETMLRSDIAFGDEERKTFLGYIASEAERLTKTVDRLLDVARLDTGELPLHLAPTDLRTVVSEVVAGATQAAPAESHAFVLELPDPLEAVADREKLGQILGQLVDNALKYSPGGGTVTISGRREGEAVQLLVRDEGLGIPRGEEERIFRKFYRGSGREGRLSGTGLGLFIARGLVTAMGGRIWVDSSEGAGSTFAIELPGVPQRVVTTSAGSGV